jgi:sugar phosphate isomerase/epimerase
MPNDTAMTAMASMPAPRPAPPRLGIQLYTVRDLTGDTTFRDTLRALADLGFEGVEFAWKYGGMQPAALAAFLDSLGLACCGLHVKLEELLDPGHAVYDYALATGSPFVTTSLCGREAEWPTLLPQLERAGRVAADQGLEFTYHNHWQEFNAAPGASAFDRLVEATDPALVKLELDLGWAQKAGWNPMDLWRQCGQRTPQIHLRDYDTAAGQVCDVGDGFIDTGRVFALARELGTRWLIYEQDRYPVSALESCRVCSARCAPQRAPRPAPPMAGDK